MKDFIFGLVVSCAAVFAPIKGMILVAHLLILADLITGLLASKKRGEWVSINDIKSSGLRRTVSKFLIYNAAIMLGFLTETYMISGFIPLSVIASGIIGVVEMKSILENLDTLNGNPLFKALIEKLGSVNDKPKDK